MKGAVIAAAVLLLASSPSLGANQDGNTLLEQCQKALLTDEEKKKNPSVYIHSVACLSFVHAGYYAPQMVQVVLLDSVNPEEMAGGMFCGPVGLKNGQLARIFVKYLEKHPEKLHEPAAYLALEAWADAFPCEGSTPKKGSSP